MKGNSLIIIGILLIFSFGCKNDEIEVELANVTYEEVMYNEEEKYSFDKYFHLIEEFSFNMIQDDDHKILEFTKVIEKKNGELLILDRYATSMYLVDTGGILKKRFARKGEGPGEFQVISDFCLDDNEDIYILDIKNRVSKFSYNLEFIKSFELSFFLRAPERIMYLGNDKFLITAYQNLSEGSTKNDYEFLEYDKKNYLHIYNSKFDKIISFGKLSSELRNTKGRLSRSIGQFISNSLWLKRIITVSQEGFYNMKIYTTEGKLERIIEFSNNKFKSINLNITKDLKFSNNSWNYNQEKIGQIIADHSTIRDIHKIGKYYVLTIYSPYENFYPQFRTKLYDDNFHYDIFYFDNKEINPAASNIEGRYKLIGVGLNNTSYFTNVKLNSSKIILYKYKMM
jgi:hypothetical protein